jgi:hypothetical protein
MRIIFVGTSARSQHFVRSLGCRRRDIGGFPCQAFSLLFTNR